MIEVFKNRVYLEEIITATDSYHKKIISIMDEGLLFYSRDNRGKRYVKRDFFNYWMRNNKI